MVVSGLVAWLVDVIGCLRGFTIDCWWVLVMVLDCEVGCLCWLIRFGLMLVCCFSCV